MFTLALDSKPLKYATEQRHKKIQELKANFTSREFPLMIFSAALKR